MKKIFRCGINLYANYKNFCERICYSRLILLVFMIQRGREKKHGRFFLNEAKTLNPRAEGGEKYWARGLCVA
jgi:hypothetical protein